MAFNKAKCVRLLSSQAWKLGLSPESVKFLCQPKSAFKNPKTAARRDQIVRRAKYVKKNWKG